MLAMIPDRYIRFQAKFRAAIKEICRLMPKRRTSREAGPTFGIEARRATSSFRRAREALCHISHLQK